MSQRVTVLGLGAMGAPIAVRLHDAGLRVTVFDPDPGRIAPLAAAGLEAAQSAYEAAAEADVLVLMVANAVQADEALFGHEGAVASLKVEATVLIMSTIGPDAIRRIADKLSAVGAGLVDAPVSGGVGRAVSGTLLVMAAGTERSLRAVSPILALLGDPVTLVGTDAGAGQSVKLVNQLLCGVHIAAAAEAMAFAEALGLDPSRVWDVVRQGAAASFMLEDRGRRMVTQTFEPVNSAIDIFIKDLGLVTAAANNHSFQTVVADAAERMFQHAAAVGLGSHDDAELMRSLVFAKVSKPAVLRAREGDGNPDLPN